MTDYEQRRSEILNAMAQLDRMQCGHLSEQFFETQRGGRKVLRGPYYVLQHWLDGKKVCRRVPAEQAQQARLDVEGYRRFELLAREFAQITERWTLERAVEPESKKNAPKFKRNATKRRKPS